MPLYWQCGGNYYEGSTECEPGLVCKKMSARPPLLCMSACLLCCCMYARIVVAAMFLTCTTMIYGRSVMARACCADDYYSQCLEDNKDTGLENFQQVSTGALCCLVQP